MFYETMPLIRFDLNRARQEGVFPTLALPQRLLDCGLSSWETVARLNKLNETKEKIWVSFDIEGYVERLTHCSIATSPAMGFIIAFDNPQWSIEEEEAVWRALSRVLMSPRIPKVLQNSLYDLFVLAYSYKIMVSGLSWDTMLGHWELYAELEKNLALQASIYTREPYYKDDRVHDSVERRYRYCCLDSATTLEIMLAQKAELARIPATQKHFDLLMRLLRPLLFMELQGINYDSESSKKALVKVYE